MDGIPREVKPTVKIILVGNSGVGKTCLIAAYLNQAFDSRTTSTVAPAYSCKDITKSNGTRVTLQIWDTAGQERYASISQLFFRDADCAIICFDLTDQNSITDIPDWIKRVQDEVPSCHLFAVATKTDLYSSDKEKMMNDAKAQLTQYNFENYFMTSSLKKEGVNEVFQQAGELYSQKGEISKLRETNEKKSCC